MKMCSQEDALTWTDDLTCHTVIIMTVGSWVGVWGGGPYGAGFIIWQLLPV